MKPSLTIWCLFLLVALPGVRPTFAQKHTLSGTITDAQTGETLIGAGILAVTLDKGTASNTYGFYSLTLPRTDSLTVLFSFLGYTPQLKKVYLTQDIALDVRLEPTSTQLGEITVSAERANADNVRVTRMGVMDVPIQAVETLPAILGEQDVLKVIQLLPGVQAGQEGTTGYYVRGGNIDQNLVQLDEATVYNPNHLFGLFSTFNTRALNNVQLVTGGFPANYGGRLSSVLQISMREGNQREFVTQGGLGLISSQLSVEGPIKKDRASFIISGRRSYLDLIMRPFQKANNTNLYYFYDVNAKLNYQLSRTDRVYFSLFTGRDDAEYVDASSLGYGVRFGNSTATLRWNHLFGGKLFSNTSLILNKYFIQVNTIQGPFYSQNYSGIRDLTAKTEFEYYPNPAHNIRLGALVTRHVFSSTGNEGRVPQGQQVGNLTLDEIPERKSTEGALYVNDRWEVSNRFGINVGLRVPYYSAPEATYLEFEPRLSMKVGLGETSSVKASYTVMNQFIHLVPSTTASVPTDIWTPSSKVTRPQRAWQVALGYFRNFADNAYESSVELYYKDMDHQVLFREGTQLLAYTNIDSVLTYGRGWSYGAEWFVKRKGRRLSGWVAYTLSWTRQRFAALNAGEDFPFKYDRRHNLAVVGTYEASRRWTLGANFVFLSGPAYTLPLGRVYASLAGDLYSGLFYDYDKVNNFRLGAYHRLDVAATYHLKPRWFEEADLVISLYNIYSRLNPYFVFLDLDNQTGEPVAKQVALLPLVPSVSFNFRF